MQQRFELGRHDQVNKHDRQAQCKHQGFERSRHFLALSLDVHFQAIGQGHVRQQRLNLADRATEITVGEVGLDQGQTFLVAAADFRRAFGRPGSPRPTTGSRGTRSRG